MRGKIMKEIAIYGKGGIGKSTVSANITAAMALKGKKVIQVGCDPKHDSTRFLLHGTICETVLDYLKETPPEACKVEDIIFEGFSGVHCVEAGGPEPGVGCAGRGILTTFELLNRLGIRDHHYDIALYDVLGDVVCGGFAVPMRTQYADQIYIVTSGEFMSIYAANNILRGLQNYDQKGYRAGGIILNERQVKDEEIRVSRFAKAVGLPIIAKIPRSEAFAESERAGCTLMENFPESPVALILKKLSETILNQKIFYKAAPLSDEILERVVLKTQQKNISKKIKKTKITIEKKETHLFSKNLAQSEPLHGCAFNGTLGIATQLKDAFCLAHGPASCAHIAYQSINSVGRKEVFQRGIVLPLQTAPAIISSNMNESVMVFGGMEALKAQVQTLMRQKPKVIFVLTTCPSGIIGDHVEVVSSLSNEKTKVIVLKSDGNLTGDYLQGIMDAYQKIGRTLIKKDVKSEPNTVNLIGEKFVADATIKNFETIKKLLDALNLKINTRFIYDTSVEAVQYLLKGCLNLPAYDDYLERSIETFLKKEYQLPFFDKAFPVGMKASVEWLQGLAAIFHKESLVMPIVIQYQQEYNEAIRHLKPDLKGKKMMIVTYNHHIDWILKTAIDLEMVVVKVGILNFSQDDYFITEFQDAIQEFQSNYQSESCDEDLERLKPDLLITNYISNTVHQAICLDTIPLCPEVGFLSGISLAERWADMFKLNLQEGWRKDEAIYRKYFA